MDHPATTPEVGGRTLVLGLGNEILTDDAVGLMAARLVAVEADPGGAVDVRDTMEMGLALLDFMEGYDRVVILDAIQTGRAPPGTIHEVDADGLRELAGRTPHFVGVGETLALGRRLGLEMPRRVVVLAMEVEDPFTLGTELTAAVQAALPALVGRAKELVLAGLVASVCSGRG